MAAHQVHGHTRDVLALLAAGLTNKQIAFELQLAEATVKWHVSKLLALYGKANRAGVVLEAIRRGDLLSSAGVGEPGAQPDRPEVRLPDTPKV